MMNGIGKDKSVDAQRPPGNTTAEEVRETRKRKLRIIVDPEWEMRNDRKMRSKNKTMQREELGLSDSLTTLNVRHLLMDNISLLAIILAICIGLFLGFMLRNAWKYNEHKNIWYLGWPGRLLIKMLKLLMIPLVVSSLVTVMADLGQKPIRNKLSSAVLLYYSCTTALAVLVGVILAVTIKPGAGDGSAPVPDDSRLNPGRPRTAIDIILDLISSLVPDNVISACFQSQQTKYNTSESVDDRTDPNGRHYNKSVHKPYTDTRDRSANLLGLVAISIVTGSMIDKLGIDGYPLKKLFIAIYELVFRVVNLILLYTPFGLTFLIAARVVATEDSGQLVGTLGLYITTVLTGLAIHSILVLPGIYYITTRKNPVHFFSNQLQSIVFAWGTGSSTGTLPVTMQCLANRNAINFDIVRFVAPLGAFLNLEGTALYEAIACTWVANRNNMQLSMLDLFLVSFTATVVAIGAAGMPDAGKVTMLLVLESNYLPTDDLIHLLAVDWLLDRFRTSANVWSDAVGAGVIHHFHHQIFEEEEDVGNPVYLEVKEEFDDSESNVSNAQITTGTLSLSETLF